MQGADILVGNDTKRLMTSRPSSTVSYARSDALVQGPYAATPPPDQAMQGLNILNHGDAMARFNVCNMPESVACSALMLFQMLVKEFEAIAEQLPVNSLAALPSQHEVRQFIRQILQIASQSAETTPLAISQKIVQLLYRTQTQLGREVYVALLQHLCTTFEEVHHEAIPWLTWAEDDVSVQ